MKPWKPALLAISMVALARIVACDSTATADTPDRLITEAEAGSEAALAELEALSAAGGLASLSDAIGQAATRITLATPTRFDTEDPSLIRWQQIFLDTDPIANASQETRLAFARAHTRFDLIGPSSIDPGQEHDIGVAKAVALRDSTLGSSRDLKISFEYDNYFVEEQNIFQGVSHFSEADIQPMGLSGSAFVRYSKVLLPVSAALGGPVSLRCTIEVRLVDQSQTPPAVFAEWTEELTKRATAASG